MIGRSAQIGLNDSVLVNWAARRIAESAIYITIIIGYLLSILSSEHITSMNLTLFTTLHLLYCLTLFSITRGTHKLRWLSMLSLVLLEGLTFASGMMELLGIPFDWLLYLATVGVFFSFFSTQTAVLSSLLLYLVAGINSVLLPHSGSFDMGWISLLAGFGFVAAFSYSTRAAQIERARSHILLQQLEQSNKELLAAHEQLQAYANQVEELAVVRERTRLAREIHDTLGHYLTILTIQLETISKLQAHDPAQAILEVNEARHVAAQSMQEVRNAVAALRPTSIASLDLRQALTQLGEEFKAASQETELTLDLETQLPEVSPDVQLTFYRAAQEALTNVRKHAHASKVLLRLRYEDDQLELVILDNGDGSSSPDIAAPQTSGGVGLIGLRERIELLGGEISHHRVEPAGYRVTVRLPMSMPSATMPPDQMITSGGEQ